MMKFNNTKLLIKHYSIVLKYFLQIFRYSQLIFSLMIVSERYSEIRNLNGVIFVIGICFILGGNNGILTVGLFDCDSFM